MSADTWTGHVDHDWSLLDNWSSGSPAPDDDVTVPKADDDAHLDDFSTIKSLTIDDGGELDLQGQADLNVLQSVLNDGMLTLGEYGASAGATLTADGKLTNNGTIYVGAAGSGLDDQLEVKQLDNTGYLYLNGTSSVEAIVDVESAAGTGTAGTLTGTIELAGDALLEFADDEIVTNSAYLVLTGSDAFVADAGQTSANSALSGLTSNTNRLALDDASVSTSGDLFNSGTLALDYRRSSGAALAIQGALTNSGAVDVGNAALTAPDQLTAASFDNMSGGVLNIQGSATKHATVKIGFATPGGGALANAGKIELDQSMSAGGSSLQIDGALTNDDNLQIGNNKLSASDGVSAGSLVNEGAITLISNGAMQAKLAATTAIENSGALTANASSRVTAGSFQQDAAGDVSLQVTGLASFATLAATGGVALDGGMLSAPTSGFTYAADETFNLVTFGHDQLVGVFDDLSIGGVAGDGASVTLAGGLLAGLEYDDSAGVLELKVVTAPSSTADLWTGASQDWSDDADWSNNAPDFYSAVSISTGAATTVTLSSDKTIDSLQIGDADALTTDAGTDLSIGAGANVAGALDIGGEAFIDGAVTDNGAIAVSGSLLDVRGAVSGSGSFAIGAGAELEFGSSDSATVAFDGAGATLKLDQAASFSGKLDDMAVGDVIDLTNVKYTGGALTTTGDPLSVTEGGATYTFDFMQNVDADTFAASADASGAGTEIELDAACYCRGARIATPSGDVAIETLREGDLVLTAAGATRPVRWIGRRAINAARHRDPPAVWPVRISAGAFGEGLPRRHLCVSPGHNIASCGALAPASALINGLSVAQIAVDRVEYWHVELDAHDVILAEGLPAESYLDTGNRRAFFNGEAFIDAFPDQKPKDLNQTCLPLVAGGPRLVEIKTLLFDRLQARGFTIVEESDAHLLADGERYEADWVSERRMIFVLPAGCQSIVLKSRVFIPAHSLAESRDTRSLGLCVRSLMIDRKSLALEQRVALGAGWHPPEISAGEFNQRWTDGEATLPPGARTIIVELAGPGYYWRAPPPAAASQAA